ncbi:MAG: YebC/PmpR family DNA-binding transcriptional regulator [Gemmatimonadales bacterium]
MAGHSKWKQIKHYKAATDAKRGALFTKLIREITMAAKMGGGDPAGNARLRVAIEAGRAKSMPKENIDRAIKKGTGELEGVDYQEVTYEGYAPGGVALIIDAVTDNPTRTVADVRHKMSRGGGNLGTPNSVAFMFEKKGLLTIPVANHADEDALLEAALEAGAEDFRREDDESYLVTTEPGSFHAVMSALEQRGIIPSEAELAMVPKSTVTVAGTDVELLLKLIESIEELDDVQKVWANFDIDDADLASL